MKFYENQARTGLGLIGAGPMARRHLAAFRALPVRLETVFDPAPEPLAGLPACARAGSLDELLATPGLGAVLIASPPEFHADQALRAVQAGLPVLLEKPAGLELAEVDRLLAEGSGPAVLVGYNLRHHPAVRELHREVRSGRWGELLGLRSIFTTPSQREAAGWRAGRQGGPWLDLALHHFDLWRFLSGEEVELRTCRRQGDLYQASASSRSGVTLELAVSTHLPDCQRLEAICAGGIWSVDLYRQLHPRPVHEVATGHRLLDLAKDAWLSVRERSRGGPFQRCYRHQAEHFWQVWSRGAAPEADLHDGRESLRLALEAERLCR